MNASRHLCTSAPLHRPQVAVIGCGYWGKNLARNFRQLGTLRMVCDTAEQGRKLAAEMAPHVEVVADIDEVLSASVEGVVIATPAETHYELARQAGGSKVHIEGGNDVADVCYLTCLEQGMRGVDAAQPSIPTLRVERMETLLARPEMDSSSDGTGFNG